MVLICILLSLRLAPQSRTLRFSRYVSSSCCFFLNNNRDCLKIRLRERKKLVKKLLPISSNIGENGAYGLHKPLN